MESKSIKRDISIDVIKFLAIIGVVIIHSCSFSVPLASSNWFFSLFFRSISSASVPLFLMSSGALMLNSEKEISLGKLYFKNILRLVVAMFFWATLYKVYSLYNEGIFTGTTFLKSLGDVFFFKQEFHFYYIHMMFIVYAFLPVTKSFVNSASRGTILYFLLLWFGFAIVYPTSSKYTSLFASMATQYGINMTYASIGYGVLGCYLKKYPIKKIYAFLLVILGAVSVFVLTYIKSMQYEMLYERCFEGVSVYVCMLATGLFSLLSGVNLKEGFASAAVVWVSKASFCIYLVHVLVMYLLEDIGISINMATYIISVPVFALITLVISAVVYIILSAIPILKKWII